MSLIVVFQKTKDAMDDVDYSFDYAKAPWLAVGDTLASSTWAVESPPDGALTIHDSAFTDTISTIWVSGGTSGQSYTISNTIVTVNNPSRHLRRALVITIK